ncbi:MAG TPA: response regulator transcription factor [Cyclobacteriaceae bacterium]
MISTSKPVVYLVNLPFLIRRGITQLSMAVSYEEATQANQDTITGFDYQQPHILVLGGEHNDLIKDSVLRNLQNMGANILLVLDRNQLHFARKSLEIGIPGIVTIDCSEEEITSAFKMVASKKRFYCSSIFENVVQKNTTTSLTPREKEVITLIVKGLSTNAIADQLHVSTHTINSHRKNILRKLNLKSPTEMIIYALENGLIE